MYIFKLMMGALALIFTAIPAMAQGKSYTLPAPSGVPDGSRLVLFGQGGGQSYPVRGGKVTIPGDIGATSIFGNFRRSDGTWLKVEQLNGIPTGWAARIIAGDCKGDPLACDGVEAFLDQGTFALVAPITTDGANSSFVVSVQGGQACLQLPSELNSISFSGARSSRPGVGLSTGGPKGLVNVGRLLRETTPVGVVDNGRESAQVVALTKVAAIAGASPLNGGRYSNSPTSRIEVSSFKPGPPSEPPGFVALFASWMAMPRARWGHMPIRRSDLISPQTRRPHPVLAVFLFDLTFIIIYVMVK
jgi:hypothetical protein